MIRLLGITLLLGAAIYAQRPCSISALDSHIWAVDCDGTGHVSRAALLTAAARAGFPGGVKIETSAKLAILRGARDSGISRASAAGDATWSSCATWGGVIALKATDPKAKAAAAAGAAICTLWGVLHRRVKDDAAMVQSEAVNNAAVVLPDHGVDLPWSGIIVTGRVASGSYSFEVTQ